MLRPACALVAVATVAAAACSTPPDTCDQNIFVSLSKFCENLVIDAAMNGSGGTWKLLGPFACIEGGSGSANLTGQGEYWSGSITFDGCKIGVDGGDMVVTGILPIHGDGVNAALDWVDAATLTLQGSAAGCAPVDETCPVMWMPLASEQDDRVFSRQGTVCGHHFP